ncbi:RagB/SusD family nutrient uptake outer membrane protein [Nibrella saemangeumensis]|uniref:RagB/SusD family nutrient uptake outer membrane protein n=1 Tax=Nibrella saemangeumensis TaxID=1084526 RepID=A0ABP8MS15_9BACT
MFRFNILVFAGCTAVLLAGQACTDLNEKTFDVIPTDQFGTTPEQQAALIGPLYNSLGEYFGNYNELNATTDEQIVPTRGGDWKDGDNWKRLYTHTWDPITDNNQFNGRWNWIYNSITSINQQLGTITDENTRAELRALRAFFHYVAMDLFGNVIIAENVGTGSPDQKSRTEVFNWVEKELLEVYPKLSETVGGAYYGRFNKYVVDMILAKMYLNAQVYTGTPQWQKSIDRLNTIINSGKFSLSGDFFDNFKVQNQGSPEIILATPFDNSKRGGMNIHMRTLHYDHKLTYNLPASPWNGYATIAEFYNTFTDQDARKKMWIVGQQFDAAGTPLKDGELPLVITPEIPAFEMPAGPVARLAGARSQKYEIQRNNTTNDQSNDFVIYRLADAYLMRGEANFRLGKTADALADINRIRSRAGVQAFSALTLNDILAERGRELAWEYHRRQDLIRFDQYTRAWQFKPASQKFRELFPIPKDQLSLNPKLKQNPGY